MIVSKLGKKIADSSDEYSKNGYTFFHFGASVPAYNYQICLEQWSMWPLLKFIEMDIEKIIEEWIAVSNSYNTEKYLEFYTENAVLDDVSVGKKFIGKNNIGEYFESYFIGYKTQTKKVELVVKDGNQAHLEVEFSGDFAEGKLGGTFDLTFKDGKIAFASADLIV